MRPTRWRTTVGLATGVLALLLADAAAASSNLWIDVPFVAQEENGCGSASLAMLIGYWSRHGVQRAAPPDAPAIQRELYVAAQHGIPAASMQRYLENAGFRTFMFRGEWQDLERQIARGRPLIVAFDGGGSTLHYAVATGIEDGAVALNDPAEGKLRKHSRTEFERRWSATGYWTLLAVPGGI